MRPRRGPLVAAAIALAAFLAWHFRGTPPSSAPPPSAAATAAAGAGQPAPAPPAKRPPVAAPAIQLSRAVTVRKVEPIAPGALEGTVVDAANDAGISGAELTFSHDDGAWSTTSGPGGAFRFAPRATGTYRLVSIEAKGYQPFEREFGHSPVSFTSIAGRDVTGVVLRLEREPAEPARRVLFIGAAATDDVSPLLLHRFGHVYFGGNAQGLRRAALRDVAGGPGEEPFGNPTRKARRRGARDAHASKARSTASRRSADPDREREGRGRSKPLLAP